MKSRSCLQMASVHSGSAQRCHVPTAHVLSMALWKALKSCPGPSGHYRRLWMMLSKAAPGPRSWWGQLWGGGRGGKRPGGLALPL